MSRFISITIIMTFLAVAFFINTKNSDAGIGFLFGPDGNAYKLIDCGLQENIDDLSKCPGSIISPIGQISWNTSRGKAQNMTFKGLPCDLASPSTEEINDFLKNFPGFEEACNPTGCSGFELCAWFGGLKVPPDTRINGPFFFVNNLTEPIPCPFDSVNGPACDPIVDPGVDTDLTFQDWCRDTEQTPNCPGNEPNLGDPKRPPDDFMNYLLLGDVIGWSDCRDFTCVNTNCQPTSYFVQCDIPPPTNVPTLSEWGLIAIAVVLGIVGYLVMSRRKVSA